MVPHSREISRTVVAPAPAIRDRRGGPCDHDRRQRSSPGSPAAADRWAFGGVLGDGLREWGPTWPPGAACADPVQRFLDLNEFAASRLIATLALLPIAVGLLLGVPTVSREIESGTAATVWAVAESRSEWLAWRLLSVGGLALIMLACLGIASEVLWQARAPTGVPNRFDDAGLHGASVVAKGAASFAVGALVGAMLGRTLPAVIGGAVASVVLIALGAVLRGAFEMPAEGGIDAMAVFLFDNVETALFASAAVVATLATFMVVDRRRPI